MLKRIYLPGKIYFITTNIKNRKKIFNNNQANKLFLDVLNECRIKYKFRLYGYVIIPDHIHLLIELDDDMNISDVIHRIKGNFAHQYLMMRNHKGCATRGDKDIVSSHATDRSPRATDYSPRTTDRSPRAMDHLPRVADPLWVGRRIRINPIWQKSFYDHIIRNDLDFEEKLDYIHGNPINHGLTNNLDNYLWSSYQNYYLKNDSLINIDYLDA